MYALIKSQQNLFIKTMKTKYINPFPTYRLLNIKKEQAVNQAKSNKFVFVQIKGPVSYRMTVQFPTVHVVKSCYKDHSLNQQTVVLS